MSQRILVVVGARPQFMKAAPISRAIALHPDLQERLVHTGQHFDPAMSESFFDELGLPTPAWNLGVSGGGHGEMTGRMLERLEALMISEPPDLVLVFGDTNSTLAGALAAAKLRLPVAHVEAGLRSYDRDMPEEINRVLTDQISDLLFCPTQTSVNNLAREGITRNVIHSGDVMYDAVLHLAAEAARRSTILERLQLTSQTYAVATLHRASTTDDAAKLSAAVTWLRARAKEQPVVLPLHPRTAQRAQTHGIDLSGLTLVEPLGPLDMQRLLSACAGVYTDSGGLQKEAYFHRKPCVTLRDRTEWPETVACGWNRLWADPGYAPRREISDYGAGDAAERIVAAIGDFLAARRAEASPSRLEGAAP